MNVFASASRMRRIESCLHHMLEYLLGTVFMVVFILVVVLVVLRYVFNTTIIGGNEVAVQLFIYTTSLGAAAEIAAGGHIIVDFFVNYLSAHWRRRLEVLNLILVGAFNACLMWYSIGWVRMVGGSEHPVTHIAEGFVEIALPIGCALSVLFCFTRMIIKLADKPVNET